ncbi:hypothetical protein [Ensifer sp. M14]|uniref:hypothetical protein n=1 Tax=Ensifer sp. M14 TaxID=2203782 RepID=UPI000E1E0F1C|nr:hypothetical protein [Ensifer sp. M14]
MAFVMSKRRRSACSASPGTHEGLDPDRGSKDDRRRQAEHSFEAVVSAELATRVNPSFTMTTPARKKAAIQTVALASPAILIFIRWNYGLPR